MDLEKLKRILEERIKTNESSEDRQEEDKWLLGIISERDIKRYSAAVKIWSHIHSRIKSIGGQEWIISGDGEKISDFNIIGEIIQEELCADESCAWRYRYYFRPRFCDEVEIK